MQRAHLRAGGCGRASSAQRSAAQRGGQICVKLHMSPRCCQAGLSAGTMVSPAAQLACTESPRSHLLRQLSGVGGQLFSAPPLSLGPLLRGQQRGRKGVPLRASLGGSGSRRLCARLQRRHLRRRGPRAGQQAGLDAGPLPSGCGEAWSPALNVQQLSGKGGRLLAPSACAPAPGPQHPAQSVPWHPARRPAPQRCPVQPRAPPTAAAAPPPAAPGEAHWLHEG